MKEDEARTKWCPMARVAGKIDEPGVIGGAIFSGNRFGDPFQNAPSNLLQASQCIGSDCMMWESWEYTDANEDIMNLGEGDCGLKSKDLHCNS